MRAGVNGAAGHMGRLICELLGDELVSATDRVASPGILPLAPGAHAAAEVVIDFSLPAGTRRLLDCLEHQALVVGTTGLDTETQAMLEARASQAPVIQSSNFSAGMNLLFELVARAAATLPDYDLEIVEMHHRRKRDAPSGTALTLGEAAANARAGESPQVHGRRGAVGPRSDGEIGFHALRGGDIVGEHTVYLAGPGERLVLGHLATSRSAFATGAVRAARAILALPPGLYGMRQVIDSL